MTKTVDNLTDSPRERIVLLRIATLEGVPLDSVITEEVRLKLYSAVNDASRDTGFALPVMMEASKAGATNPFENLLRVLYGFQVNPE
ncbi:MAG: hypothetical protein WC924_03960 [Candidatus Gracilibacteria bacterium]